MRLMGRLSAFALLAAGLIPAQDSSALPAQLIITYRCPPPRRAAFRQYMTESGIQRFERWRQDGVLKDYHFLFNWYTDVDTWDAMAVLTFPNFQQAVRWKEIEKTSPGGLARDAIDIAWPLNTNSADLAWSGAAEQAHNGALSVFYVVPIDSPAGADFREYANGYVLPQTKALIKEGVLASYSVFVNRYPGGKRWHGLMVLEYNDLDSFSRREEAITKVRTALRADAAWKANEAKLVKLGVERESVIADPVLSH
jgi:hypothetical protein